MSNPDMVYRTLGATGEEAPAIGIGGWHLALNYVDEQTAIRIVRTAIDQGVNFGRSNTTVSSTITVRTP